MPEGDKVAGLLRQQQDWEKLRLLVTRVQHASLAALTADELWILPGLYRKTLSDLSLLRTRGASPQLTHELSQLCNAAHAIIYRATASRRGTSLWDFVGTEIPRAVRRRGSYVLASALLMLMFAVLGWLHCLQDRSIAETVLGPRMVGSIEANLTAAREQADLGLAAQIPREQRSAMALMITLNNISVSVRAFAFGIAGGLPTVLIVAFNGYMLGAIGCLYFTSAPGIELNLPLYFIAGIAPHGSIELPAICLAAAAGMLLGFSWLFPGRQRRGSALREAAVDALRLVCGCAVTLLFAGAIEGFVTPLLPPHGIALNVWFYAKIGFGSLVFAVWLVWLMLGGRSRGSLTAGLGL